MGLGAQVRGGSREERASPGPADAREQSQEPGAQGARAGEGEATASEKEEEGKIERVRRQKEMLKKRNL